MPIIITRTAKGSELTHAEMDANLTALNTGVNGKADILAPRTEAASFVVTRANHANRVVRYTGAGAATATLNTGGDLVDGDVIEFQQAAGAGVLTLAGTGFELAQGVGGLSTTGERQSIGGTFDGSRFVVQYRNQPDATGGGGALVFNAADVVAPDNTAQNLIYTLPLGVLPTGTALEMRMWVTQGAGTAAGVVAIAKINGVEVMRHDVLPVWAEARVIYQSLFIKSQTQQFGAVLQTPDNSAGGAGIVISTADISAGATLTIHCEKSEAGRVVTFRGISVGRN